MKKSIIIYCDESSAKGLYFSNFYGGALIHEKDRMDIENRLKTTANSLNLTGEIKWTKISQQYADKYIQFIKEYFDIIEEGLIKVRIMFTQNTQILQYQTTYVGDAYFKLYYQMLKHAFGLAYHQDTASDALDVKMFLDDIPDSPEKYEEFKDYLVNMCNLADFQNANVFIEKQNISSVKSHDHLILQGADVVLGAIHFRLNKLHKAKPLNAHRRGKRTIAKEKVYNYIHSMLQNLRKGFNIGVTTGSENHPKDYWEHKYRHWSFRPK